MATLTDLESQILDELGEDSSAPEVWAGTTDLREALADALDEFAMVGPFFTSSVMIPLQADVAVYSISLDNAYPLYVRRARILEADRRLQPYGLYELVKRDAQFLISRGSPLGYTPLGPDVILFYPCNSSSTDTVQVDVVCAYAHYGYHREFLTIREEMEKGLIHYGKYYKLIQVKGNIDDAVEEFGEYLKCLGLVEEFKHHAQAVRKVRWEHGEKA